MKKRFFAFLLRHVSEWHVALTPFDYPAEQKKHIRIRVDVMSVEDHLFSGWVGDYFESDGALKGLLLEDVVRFDRTGFVADKQSGKAKNKDAYWKTIPGKSVYVPYEKILTLNIRHVDESGKLVETDVKSVIEQELGSTDVDVKVAKSEHFIRNAVGEPLGLISEYENEPGVVLTAFAAPEVEHHLNSIEDAWQFWYENFNPETGRPRGER